MKVINFSCVEILPELLKFFETKGKEGKSQTIRPIKQELLSMKEPYSDSLVHDIMIPKSRYKIGDICSLQWKQRTSPKGSWFHTQCGNIMTEQKKEYNESVWYCKNCSSVVSEIMRNVQKNNLFMFPKILGTVKIMEVFQIEMSLPINESTGFGLVISGKNKSGFNGDIDELAEKDGFKCVKDMAMWFDKNYDLSTPKIFEVRRWKFVEEFE